MTTHTPGPWVVTNRHVGITLDDAPDSHPQFDSIERPDFVAGGGIALVHRKPGMGNPNARLIAAAPDLLEALMGIAQQAEAQFQAGDRYATFNKATIASIHAAIAKATKGE